MFDLLCFADWGDFDDEFWAAVEAAFAAEGLVC